MSKFVKAKNNYPLFYSPAGIIAAKMGLANWRACQVAFWIPILIEANFDEDKALTICVTYAQSYLLWQKCNKR